MAYTYISPVINVQIGKMPRIDVSLSGITVKGAEVPVYDGAYEVSPRYENVVLPTKDKKMTDDLTVKEIAVHKVSNISGGYTVTIGEGGFTLG